MSIRRDWMRSVRVTLSRIPVDVAGDVRYGLRMLRRNPGFTAVALMTLALGTGANAAMFSIVDGVLLRPLPFPDAERLVRVYQANPSDGIQQGTISFPDFEDWRRQAGAFKALAAYQRRPLILTGRGDPIELQAAFVTADFFTVLGAPAQVGRTLLADDNREVRRFVAISDRLWRTHFAADRGVTGRILQLQDRPYTVVGVMPPTFRYPSPDTDVWAPESVLMEPFDINRARDQRYLEGMARLVEGVSLEQAQNDLGSIAARLAADYPRSNSLWGAATVVSLEASIVGDVDTALWVVLGVVGCVLLIGCVNLANLLLARGTTRSNEIAIRTALGAQRMRIVRQLLTESVVLSLIGGLLGLGLSVWAVNTLLPLSVDTLPRVEDVYLSSRVIVVGLLLALFAGILLGLLPALRAAGRDPAAARLTAGRARAMRGALVIVEVSVAVALVIGAGLMARSFLTLRSVDPGFDPHGVLAVTIQHNITGVAGPELGPRLLQRGRDIIERVSALPGVVSAGTTNILPLQQGDSGIFEFTRTDGGQQRAGVLRADRSFVSAGYLRTMRIPLLRGNPLPDRPVEGAPIPILISETAARRFWPDRDPVGQVVRASFGAPVVVTGIVGDVRHTALAEEPRPAVYFREFPRGTTTLVVRTGGDPLALARPIRRVISELDSNQPIRAIATLDDVMAESIGRDRFFTVLFAVFGGLALLLAAVGVYGIVSYTVAQRREEIGVQMALGARALDVLRTIVGGSMRLVIVGAALGACASLMLTRVLKGQLYGVSPLDPVTFIMAPAVLIVVSLLACGVPAWRATRIDAVAALRNV